VGCLNLTEEMPYGVILPVGLWFFLVIGAGKKVPEAYYSAISLIGECVFLMIAKEFEDRRLPWFLRGFPSDIGLRDLSPPLGVPWLSTTV
jgi:hypothetical protein